MRDPRPKNLNLFTIHFPIPAFVSIFHRISGFALFFLIPVLLWALNYSFTSEGFSTLSQWFTLTWVRFLIWLFLIPLIFHFVAGIRHLLMDVEVGVSFKAGWISGLLTFLIAGILVVLLGIWLW